MAVKVFTFNEIFKSFVGSRHVQRVTCLTHLRRWELCATSCHQSSSQGRVRSFWKSGWQKGESGFRFQRGQSAPVSACQGSGCLKSRACIQLDD